MNTGRDSQDDSGDARSVEDVTLVDLISDLRQLVRVTRRVERQLRRRTWTFIVVAALISALGGSSIDYLAGSQQRLHFVVDGDCDFYSSIGTLPVPRNAGPALHRIIDSARVAYRARCDQFGQLPPVVTYVPTPTTPAPSSTPPR